MRGRRSLLLLILLAFLLAQPAVDAADYSRERQALIAEMNSDARHARDALGRDTLDSRVLDVMAAVPRHEFVPLHLQRAAYENRPLPIGYGQTISQPFIVALMTDLMQIKKGDSVLEVGTGSGYHAAVLAGLAGKVYTIEIIRELADTARERLLRLGYRNVEVMAGDGYYGWEAKALFDAIVVTAAPGHVPPPLIKQLKQGGRLIIPIGGVYQVQTLMVLTKEASGRVKTRQVIPVRFVPMTGRAERE